MKNIKIIATIVIVSLFAVILGYIAFSEHGVSYEEYLSKNTSYTWEQTLKIEGNGYYDEIITLETTGGEYELTLFFEDDVLEDAVIIAKDEHYIGKLDSVIQELETVLEIDFWQNW